MINQSDLVAFGHFIRERRLELGLTQVELGARLGWAQERVSVLERGKYGLPSLPHLSRLADALALSVGRLLCELGIEGVQDSVPGADPRRCGQLERMDLQLDTMLDRMRRLEQRLHDAEQQMQRAEELSELIREQRRHMAALLAAPSRYA